MKDTMTNCKDSLERLPLYVGGELDALDAALVAGHLNQCDSCSREEKTLLDSRELFKGAVQAPAADLADLNLWTGIRASMLSEGLLGAPETEKNTWELRPVASAAPRLSLLRRVASFAAAAAVIGFASLAGSGLLGTSGETLGTRTHIAPVTASLNLLNGESIMQTVGEGQRSLSNRARSWEPAYQATFPVAPAGSSLAGFQENNLDILRRQAKSSGLQLGWEIR